MPGAVEALISAIGRVSWPQNGQHARSFGRLTSVVEEQFLELAQQRLWLRRVGPASQPRIAPPSPGANHSFS
jgi:hypothetical protein